MTQRKFRLDCSGKTTREVLDGLARDQDFLQDAIAAMRFQPRFEVGEDGEKLRERLLELEAERVAAASLEDNWILDRGGELVDEPDAVRRDGVGGDGKRRRAEGLDDGTDELLLTR